MKKHDINFEELIEHFDHDEDLFQQAVYNFCKETPHEIKTLTVACEKKDWAEVYRLAHKIFGAASNFLDNPVCQLTKQIEVMAQRNQTGGLLALSKHLGIEAKHMMTALTELSKSKSRGKRAA